MTFWNTIYNFIGVPLLYIGFMIASLFSRKIRRGIKARKSLFHDLEQSLKDFSGTAFRFWIHSSSMGEFEQAKPLIRHLKKTYPKARVVVSLFSPSAYDHVHDYQEADCVCCLPFDFRKNAKRFISLVRPSIAITIRHDLWPNHLRQLKKRNIPSILINASIYSALAKPNPINRPLFRFLYGYFDAIFTVSNDAKTYFRSLLPNHVRVKMAGDTRYDQVLHRATKAEQIVAPLRKMKGNRMGFVMGSTWPSDEAVLLGALAKLFHKGIRLWTVLVPHEPTEDRIRKIQTDLKDLNLNYCRFSELDIHSHKDVDILIVDRIGVLASLYALGELSYVGGGFGPGIHSVLEPAALGKIVLFGPKHTNSYEAGQLLKRGVGFSIRNTNEMFDYLHSHLNDPAEMERLGGAAEKLVHENKGATGRIVDGFHEYLTRS